VDPSKKVPDLNCEVRDLLLEVVDLKQEVPGLRSSDYTNNKVRLRLVNQRLQLGYLSMVQPRTIHSKRNAITTIMPNSHRQLESTNITLAFDNKDLIFHTGIVIPLIVSDNL